MAFTPLAGTPTTPSSGGSFTPLGGSPAASAAPVTPTSFQQPPTLTQSLWNNIVKPVISPAATILARPAQAVAELAGASDTQVNDVSNKLSGGLVAPVPENGADLEKDVGRAGQTVALGLGPEAGGALFGAGNSLEQGNKLLSPQTAVETVLGMAGGKALDIIGKPIFNVAGKVVGTITPDLIQNIASKGVSAITDFAAEHNILPQAISHVINSAADVADKAANAPFNTVSSATSNLTKDASAAIMNKVGRVNPSDGAKFSAMSGGKSVGQFLDDRGIYGSVSSVTAKLFDRFSQAKAAVDTALDSLPGLYKNKAVETALSDVVDHAQATSAEGARSPYLTQAETLLGKAQGEGLSMSDVNAAKRLYEGTVKLNYIKDGVSSGIERANNIDSAIRTWQQDTADKLGFTNIKGLNKETQLSKMALDAIGKKNNAQVGNNIVGLTDWIVASGLPHDPSSLALLLGKKVFGNSTTQGLFARMLSRGEKLAAPSAEVGAMNTNPDVLGLPAPGEGSVALNTPQVIHQPNTTLLPEDKTGVITQPQSQPSSPPIIKSTSSQNIAPIVPQQAPITPESVPSANASTLMGKVKGIFNALKSGGNKGFVKIPGLGDTPANVTPDAVASKMDDTDFGILKDYLKTPTDLNAHMKADPIIQAMGIGKLSPKIQNQFLKEALDTYEAQTTQTIKAADLTDKPPLRAPK